ncbi:MAG: NAD(P)/FAD-dependent oxidoreductase [Vicinamibacteria bacterium]
MREDWQRHFDDNRSLWLAGKKPYEKAPALARDRSCDVVIIGGGFTGVSTAYHLSKRFPDRSVVLIEARELANGASGRNGGQMLNWIHGFEPRTSEEAGRIYDATREGIRTVHEIVTEHGLDVPMRREGHLDVFTDAKAADAAEASLSMLASAGIRLRFLRRRELTDRIDLEGVEGAILDPEGGELDGVAFLRELRPVLEGRGVEIFEGTPALRIREGRTIEIETPSGVLKARAAVLATNAYTPHLGYFKRGLIPLHSHVVGTEARTREDWARLGWKSGANFIDDRPRLSYGTLTSSGRLLFGGGSNASYQYAFGNGTRIRGPEEGAAEAMRRQLLRYLPRLEEVPVVHRWSGPVALTLSRLPTMGVRGAHRNLYFALGYSGHGVTLANLAGKVLTDLYSGGDERWRGLPFYQRDLRYIPPEPFRFLGYHAYTKLTGRSPRTHDFVAR